MNIGGAMDYLKEGGRIYRDAWAPGIYLKIIRVTGTLSGYPVNNYVAVLQADETYIAWTCTHLDLLATDWKMMSYEEPV